MSEQEKTETTVPAEHADPQGAPTGKKAEKKNAKEDKKAARKREQEEKARQEAEAAAKKLLEFIAVFGKKELIQSTSVNTQKFTSFSDLMNEEGKAVLVRARLQKPRKQGGKLCFLELRQYGATVQAVIAFDEKAENPLPKEIINWAAKIPNESIVDVEAVPVRPEIPVSSCSLSDIELHVKKLHVVSEAAPVLPFQLVDASRPNTEESEPKTTTTAGGDTSPTTNASDDSKKEKAAIAVNQDTRLNNRWLDLRTPASNAIFRVQSRVCQYFREYLLTQDFVEIHTPKLIGTASEGGANVFKLPYFGKDVFLSQSPQLYKQMTVQGDLPRVFEVGSVFRAENANTHRHLTEFVGLDIEMTINEHYYEVLDVAEELFAYMFARLGKLPELAPIKAQHPSSEFVYNMNKETVDSLGIGIIDEGKEPTDPYQGRIRNRETGVLRMPLPLAIRFLNTKVSEDKQIPENEDMGTESEKMLGVFMKERYGVDFYILDRFPATARPFYTMPDPKDPEFTNSFDMFMRGEEISSGAQRIHDCALLEQVAAKKGVNLKPIEDYVKSFSLGAWPHGGFGVGMERVVMLYLGLKNVRYTSLYPRDPARVTP